ncbi:P-loop containing nucleoside triphosphate hydrolase protein [Gonapodya prolifera JEL478]|uniref:p-loop containing nucleoside triphosphate hydrolase protein n=1 Tax=Gonapodya prolifera (strain JEL478) TaxID=1344416 RepID=A0A139A881_GONPJ|nr:P-loop containing nucleoside triphosphate hydrolase protein [Gonapodya prolifera JEL478]|eukprot:KXS12914.1 P-loop containing nucleoside triphosphate hydrolase protein [Gonapodya prolifera JEL478]
MAEAQTSARQEEAHLVKISAARSYQAELFEKAKKENIIAVLDTGTGKTYIAVLLIRHIWESQRLAVESGSGRRKLTFFLVNLVPLVFQQYSVLSNNLNLRCEKYCGEMGCDFFSRETWLKKLEEFDVHVMTAQIFLHIVTSGYVSMSDINLIVFDEAHHAAKNHPYNQVMRDCFAPTEMSHRPKIFAMTASPAKIGGDINTIEIIARSLFSIPYTSADVEAIRQHAPRPFIRIMKYSPAAAPGQVALFERLDVTVTRLLGDIPRFASRSVDKADEFEKKEKRKLNKIVEDRRYLAEEIGTWAVERSVRRLIIELKRKLDVDLGASSGKDVLGSATPKRLQKGAFDSPSAATHKSGDSSAPYDDLEDLETDEYTLSTSFARYAAQQIVSTLSEYISVPLAPPQDATVTPKVRALCEILNQHRERTKFNGIVFVERRITAATLTELLSQYQPTKEWIKVASLVGHGEATRDMYKPGGAWRVLAKQADEQIVKAKFAMAEMSFKEQNRVIFKFKKGRLNLMIATQVGEEGLDVQPCHLVIRFDIPRTTISYIQSRGRARQHQSSFYFMVDGSKTGHARQVTKLLQGAEQLRNTLLSNNSSTLMGIEEPDPDYEADSQVGLRSNTTTAVLTMGLVVGALFRFCGKLPSDKHFAPRPEFDVVSKIDGMFTAAVTLPTLLPPELRHFTSGDIPWGSRWSARRAAAREAMKALYEAKWLDEYFQPSIPGAEESQQDPVILDAEFLTKYGDDKKPLLSASPYIPRCWSDAPETRKWFLSAVKEEGQLLPVGFVSLGMGTRAELDLRMHGVDESANRPKTFSIVKVARELSLNGDQWQSLRAFSSKLMEPHFRAKVDPEVTSYAFYLAPVASWGNEYEVDWNVVQQSLGEPVATSLTDTSTIKGSVVISQVRDRFHLVTSVAQNLNPWSQLPYPLDKRGQIRSVGDYYLSSGLGKRESIDRQQPLLAVRTLRGRLDFNRPPPPPPPSHVPSQETPDLGKQKHRGPPYLLPQFVKTSPIAFALFDYARLFPALWSLLHRFLSICDFLARLNLPFPASPHLLLPALSPSSHPIAPGPLQPEYDYERLETFGDSFLKLHVAESLVAAHPRWLEGALTDGSQAHTNNRTLWKRALKTGASWEHIFAVSRRTVNRNEWTQLKLDAATNDSIHVSKKQIADTVEALIGAALRYHGADLARAIIGHVVQVPKVVDVDAVVTQECRGIATLEGLGPAYMLRVRDVEKMVGYEFKRKALVLTALTHGTARNTPVESYQRLEFLGDAVFDFILLSHLFTSYPSITPYQLTLLRQLSVNNKTQAYLCVKLGLHKLIDHGDRKLIGAFGGFGEEVEVGEESSGWRWNVGRDGEDGAAQFNNGDSQLDQRGADELDVDVEERTVGKGTIGVHWWRDLDPPKVLSDVLEAVIGACVARFPLIVSSHGLTGRMGFPVVQDLHGLEFQFFANG